MYKYSMNVCVYIYVLLLYKRYDDDIARTIPYIRWEGDAVQYNVYIKRYVQRTERRTSTDCCLVICRLLDSVKWRKYP